MGFTQENSCLFGLFALVLFVLGCGMVATQETLPNTNSGRSSHLHTFELFVIWLSLKYGPTPILGSLIGLTTRGSGCHRGALLFPLGLLTR